MVKEQVDKLILENNKVVFVNTQGTRMDMPNLTGLVNWYLEHKPSEISDRIADILSKEIGDLLISEVMIDMTNEKTQERLRNGEISKNMGHVHTYNIVLDSHVEQAKVQFEEGVAAGTLIGKFEDCFFAQFPYGMVIMRDMFKDYKNTHYIKTDIEELIK